MLVLVIIDRPGRQQWFVNWLSGRKLIDMLSSCLWRFSESFLLHVEVSCGTYPADVAPESHGSRVSLDHTVKCSCYSVHTTHSFTGQMWPLRGLCF